MSRYAFEATAESTADPTEVFAVLADGGTWCEWAGPMVVTSSWEREGEPAPGGVGAVRRLGWKRLASREQVVVHEPPHRLDYVVLSGLPCRDYRARVDLRPRPGGGTSVVWQAGFRPLVPGTGPLVRLWLRAVVRGLASRLAARAGR